jgi:hypothetical protein
MFYFCLIRTFDKGASWQNWLLVCPAEWFTSRQDPVQSPRCAAQLCAETTHLEHHDMTFPACRWITLSLPGQAWVPAQDMADRHNLCSLMPAIDVIEWLSCTVTMLYICCDTSLRVWAEHNLCLCSCIKVGIELRCIATNPRAACKGVL